MGSLELVIEHNIAGRRVRLLVKDPTEYLQSHWVRGDFYEYDLYGSDRMRRVAGFVIDRVASRVRHTRRMGMLRYIGEHYTGGTFVDVGSCIGNHTLFFAVACKASRVFSFEPVPELFAHQREIIEMNALDNVTMFETALGAARGTSRITRSNMRVNAGMSRLDEKSGGAEVSVRTLDEVISSAGKIEPIVLIKVDVEGFNVPVIEGAAETIRKHRPDVFVECETKSELARVERVLASLGLRRDDRYVFNLTPTYLFRP